ncbi:MAG: hypothetical protein KKA05_02220, partial [Alphaproteobacteria bacterium]|nr:hypothetical protein [Alphaproteobacteria bacterium]
MKNFYRIIFLFFIVFMLAGKIAEACTIFPETGTSDTPVTIKVGETYFQIPEKYLYTFKAVPAERSSITLKTPHQSYVSLIKKGERGCGDSPHTSISESVDFCGQDGEVFAKLKASAKDTPPSTWERDLELANKFYLGKSPCGDETPLSWKDTYTEKDVTKKDISDGLKH